MKMTSMLLCALSAVSILQAGAGVSVQVRSGPDYYAYPYYPYYDEEVIWFGPGYYYGYYFGNQYAFESWHRHYYYDHHHGNYRGGGYHGGGGNRGGGHGGGHR